MIYELLKKIVDLDEIHREAYLQNCISTIDQQELYRFLQEFNGLAVTTKNKSDLLKQLSKVISEPTSRNIIKYISEIPDCSYNRLRQETRERTLERVQRYTQAAKKRDSLHHSFTKYDPDIHQYQVIKVLFSGIGSELDDEHYAIVWKVEPKSDNIVVIPTNSFKDKKKITATQFDIGTISLLPPVNTLVLLEQTTSISRRRIVQDLFPANRGNRAVIDGNQIKRIEEGLRILWLKEPSLVQTIKDSGMIPEFLDYADIQYMHLHRPYKKIKWISPNRFQYNLDQKDANGNYEIFSVKLYESSINKHQTEKIIRTWSEAVAEYESDGITLKKSREDAKNDAFNSMRSFIKT